MQFRRAFLLISFIASAIMFKRSDPAVSSTSKARTNPFTPMRRFLFKLELLKPIVALGKRVRDQSHVADVEKKISQTADVGSSSFITTEPRTVTSTSIKEQTREGTARLALQQHDQPLDTIVITTLPSYPFCCHEDLLMMSRSELVKVAALLNSRLPACSQIKLIDGVPDAHIRYSIETLVGIVPDMPGAPKAIKYRRPVERMDTRKIDLLSDPEQDILPSPPTSPLSMRLSRRQEKALPVMMMSPPHLLERLEEEDESDFFSIKGPLTKKRKVYRSTSSIDEDIDMEGCTPTKARDLRLPMSLSPPSVFMNSASPHRVLRSHGQRRIHALAQPSSPSPISSPNVFKVDSAFVNLKPRHRSTSKNKSGGRTRSGSSRKANKAKRDYTPAIALNDSPFKLPRNKPFSSTSTQSSNSSDEKATSVTSCEDESEDNNNNTGTYLFVGSTNMECQMTGGIENLSV